MTKIIKSIEIDALPKKVWTLIVQHLKYPDHPADEEGMAPIKAVRGKAISKKRAGVGVTTRWTYEFKGKTYTWDDIVTEWVDNKRIAWKSTSTWQMEDSFDLEPTEKGTRLIYTMDYKLPYGFLEWIYGKLRLQKPMEKTLENTLMNMKRMVEKLP